MSVAKGGSCVLTAFPCRTFWPATAPQRSQEEHMWLMELVRGVGWERAAQETFDDQVTAAALDALHCLQSVSPAASGLVGEEPTTLADEVARWWTLLRRGVVRPSYAGLESAWPAGWKPPHQRAPRGKCSWTGTFTTEPPLR